jgi:hypothetical protein
VGATPERLNKQDELFGEHGRHLPEDWFPVSRATALDRAARLIVLSGRFVLQNLGEASPAILFIDQID